MRKGPGSVYDKWNISVVICDTDISRTANQVMVTTVELSKWWLQLNKWNISVVICDTDIP